MASMVPFFAALVLMIVGKELGSSQAFSLNGFTNDVLHFDQEQYMLHGSKLFPHLQIPDFLATFKTKTKDESKWTCGKSYCYYCFDIQDHKACVFAVLYTNPTVLLGGATLDKHTFLLSTVKCNTAFCAGLPASLPNMEDFCMDFEDVTLSDKSASANVTLYYKVGKKPYKLPLGPFTIPPKKMSLFE